MSARQRFQPNASKTTESNDSDANKQKDNENASDRLRPLALSPLKDSSNSPRPATKNDDNGTKPGSKGSEKKNISQETANIDTTVAAANTHEPLNIGSLVQSKNKKSESNSQQNRRPRNSNILKPKRAEQEILNKIRSSDSFPMSSQSLQNAHPSTASTIAGFNDMVPMTPRHQQNLPVLPGDTHILNGLFSPPGPQPGQHPLRSSTQGHSSRLPLRMNPNASRQSSPFDLAGPTAMPTAATTNGQMSRESFEPNRREVFPLMNTNSSGNQQGPSGAFRAHPQEDNMQNELICDYEVPFDRPGSGVIEYASHINQESAQLISSSEQRPLRRSTKRIGHNMVDEDQTEYGRDGKRQRVEAMVRMPKMTVCIND